MKAMLETEIEPTKRRRKPHEIIAYLLLTMGGIAIVFSFVFTSFLLAFIGLGLTFWSALIVFLRTTRYVKANLFETTPISSLRSIDQVISHFQCKGRGIYMPKTYFKELKEEKIFIPAKDEIVIPPAEEVAKEKFLVKDPRGICLTPSGLSLANLFESELGTDFSRVSVDYLARNLPKLFIEDLEMARDFEMNVVGDVIHVRITDSIYNSMCRELRKLSNVSRSLSCPLCSSIACAIAKSTSRPVVIEKSDFSKDGKIIQAFYRIIRD